ncbi:MAG: glycosyltransferase family 9 protein, partial [Thermodesulfobacteriota bacterium]
MTNGAIKKILLRVPNWVGDAVMTLPALKALHEAYKGAEISILAKKTVIPIYENNPAVSDIIEYSAEHKGVRGRFKLSKKLRSGDFELAVLFQNAFDAAFISFITGIPRRVGYGRDMRSGLLTKAVPFTEEVKRLHHIEYYLNIIKALGGPVAAGNSVPELYAGQEEIKKAKAFLSEKGISNCPLIGAAPGASFGPAKMWPAER